MYEDSGVRLSKLKVDGGMANNQLFLQMLANIVGMNVATPSLLETTALGVALAAGKARGIDLFRLEHDNEIETKLHSYTPRIEGKSSLIFLIFFFIVVHFRTRRKLFHLEKCRSTNFSNVTLISQSFQ